MNLFVEENWLDATSHHRLGDSGIYETFTDSPGVLYRALLKEYGRCIGSVHVDRPGGKVSNIGWVFLKRKKYDDCDETFLAETWVTLHKKQPTRTVEYHYVELSD